MTIFVETIANRLAHPFGFDFYVGPLRYWSETKDSWAGFAHSEQGAEFWAGSLIFAVRRV